MGRSAPVHFRSQKTGPINIISSCGSRQPIQRTKEGPKSTPLALTQPAVLAAGAREQRQPLQEEGRQREPPAPRGGGRGRLSGVAAALFLLAFLLFAAPLVEMIPLAALTGVMFMVVIGTFEWTSLRILPNIPRMDAFVIILVSTVTVVHDLAIAVLVGIIVSALGFAWEQGKKMRATISISEKGAKIYHLESALFFGSAQSFKELFDLANDPEHIIIDFEQAKVYDHSGIEAIENITRRYAQQDKKLHLLNVSEECGQLLSKVDNIVELSFIDEADYHIADDRLA